MDIAIQNKRTELLGVMMQVQASSEEEGKKPEQDPRRELCTAGFLRFQTVCDCVLHDSIFDRFVVESLTSFV